ncbi:unnamed protein product [Prorocentrum cordatum]|uniref:RRM domain-containing protein n=1 Tax=Prorocentrum cordatum TaxID=2364126 RepID=A0ABN9UN00_9DINO|nr:unnamed protein product [Polarella glacialis]
MAAPEASPAPAAHASASGEDGPREDSSDLETIFEKLLSVVGMPAPGLDLAASAESLPSAVREALAVASAEELRTLAVMSAEELRVQFALVRTQAGEESAGQAGQAPQYAAREQYPEGVSVHVAGLDGLDDVWPEQLAEHFKFCGEVKRVVLKVERQFGTRLGYGYVDFADQAGAEAALSLDGAEFAGRALKVNRKRPKPDMGWGGGWADKGKGKGKGKKPDWGWGSQSWPAWGGWGKGRRPASESCPARHALQA